MTHIFAKMTVHLNFGLLTRPFISLCATAHLPRKFFPRCVCLDPVFIKEINGANSSFKYLNLILDRRQESTLFKDAAQICCWMWSSKQRLNAFLRIIFQLSSQRWDVTFCSCWNLVLFFMLNTRASLPAGARVTVTNIEHRLNNTQPWTGPRFVTHAKRRTRRFGKPHLRSICWAWRVALFTRCAFTNARCSHLWALQKACRALHTTLVPSCVSHAGRGLSHS